MELLLKAEHTKTKYLLPNSHTGIFKKFLECLVNKFIVQFVFS